MDVMVLISTNCLHRFATFYSLD